MDFQSLIAEFGKPIDEMTDEDIQAICSKLNSTQLEQFEATVKKSIKPKSTTRVSKAGKDNLDTFDKILLGGK